MKKSCCVAFIWCLVAGSPGYAQGTWSEARCIREWANLSMSPLVSQSSGLAGSLARLNFSARIVEAWRERITLPRFERNFNFEEFSRLREEFIAKMLVGEQRRPRIDSPESQLAYLEALVEMDRRSRLDRGYDVARRSGLSGNAPLRRVIDILQDDDQRARAQLVDAINTVPSDRSSIREYTSKLFARLYRAKHREPAPSFPSQNAQQTTVHRLNEQVDAMYAASHRERAQVGALLEDPDQNFDRFIVQRIEQEISRSNIVEAMTKLGYLQDPKLAVRMKQKFFDAGRRFFDVLFNLPAAGTLLFGSPSAWEAGVVVWFPKLDWSRFKKIPKDLVDDILKNGLENNKEKLKPYLGRGAEFEYHYKMLSTFYNTATMIWFTAVIPEDLYEAYQDYKQRALEAKQRLFAQYEQQKAQLFSDLSKLPQSMDRNVLEGASPKLRIEIDPTLKRVLGDSEYKEDMGEAIRAFDDAKKDADLSDAEKISILGAFAAMKETSQGDNTSDSDLTEALERAKKNAPSTQP